MNSQIILATNGGLVIAEETGGDWQPVHTGLADQKVTAVIAREGVIIAGTRNGLFRSSDGAGSWEAVNAGLDLPHIRWLAFHPGISDREFAGTEPAGIFRSTDGGDTWQASPEVANLRDSLGWWLPYSPESGCVRGFAFHGERGYAAVEVGGVLRSDDTGATWGLAPGSSGRPEFVNPGAGMVHADVHSVGVHPSSPDLVFAATNNGLYRSTDGGSAWTKINDDGYTRAFWVNDSDPQHIITAPARSVGRYGSVLESRDGGTTWADFSDGLQTPWPNTMVERFEPVGSDKIAAVLDNGDLFMLERPTGNWKQVLKSVPGINAATTMNE